MFMFCVERLHEEPLLSNAKFAHEVVILPYSEEAGQGIYSPASARIVAGLRAQGIDVACLHDVDHRIIRERLFGVPTVELAIGFGTAVAGAGAWAGIVAAFKLLAQPPTEAHKAAQAKLAVQREGPDGTTQTLWFEYTGPMDQLPDALAQLAVDQGNNDTDPRLGSS
jgi:hypothetical protein